MMVLGYNKTIDQEGGVQMNVTGREAMHLLVRAGVPARRLIYYSERQLRMFAIMYRHDGEVPEELFLRG